MRTRTSSSRGQIMVIMALALPGLLGAMALCIDVWNLYSNWVHMQIAADAAVLAGATYLRPNDASTESTADPVARTYAQNNGVQSSEITSITFAPDQTWIRMTVTRTVPFYFGRVLGLTTTPVNVAARATIQGGTGCGPGCLSPVGVPKGVPAIGTTVTLKAGTGSPSAWGSGNWAPLDLDIPLGSIGGGAKLFKNNILQGYQGTANTGDWVPTETGIMSGPTKSGFTTLINEGLASFPGDTSSSFSPSDPRLITVPVVDLANVKLAGVSQQLQIVGFVEVWVDSVTATGDVTVTFVTSVDSSVHPGGDGKPCAAGEACAPVLTE